MERVEEVSVQESGEGARGAAAGTLKVQEEVDGTRRVEAVPVRRKTEEQGAGQERGGQPHFVPPVSCTDSRNS